MARIAEITRATRETDITIRLNLDGTGEAKLDYPIGFMVHMLNTFARHGLFDLDVRARGDLEVDQHHLVEDTGIVLGQCFAKALGEKRGIRRVGSCLYPMDETLSRAAVDVSGRAFLVFDAQLSGIPLVSAPAGSASSSAAASTFQTDTIEDFWQGFVSAAAVTLHLDILRGRSDHHKIEALFKAAARALREASEIDPRLPDLIPSTKGVLA
ncbi:imidazoleglycerol-phosphate dehydratase HisB [Treponema primitia]|uniref:imidazoleglycerol-phosphate dehydratase HisB n=1 Tax=Treponema primitia TaxID=88058 RepID=UPI0002554CDB|nr:imidazoleglycerol-phosphate dehydratase HisB [Treponema primitia]